MQADNTDEAPRFYLSE